MLTEWLLTLFNFYEMGCPKHHSVYSSRLGGWGVSDSQNSRINELFEGLVPFCTLQSAPDWSRGRKTLHNAIQRFYNNGDINSPSSFVAAKGKAAWCRSIKSQVC